MTIMQEAEGTLKDFPDAIIILKFIVWRVLFLNSIDKKKKENNLITELFNFFWSMTTNCYHYNITNYSLHLKLSLRLLEFLYLNFYSRLRQFIRISELPPFMLKLETFTTFLLFFSCMFLLQWWMGFVLS